MNNNPDGVRLKAMLPTLLAGLVLSAVYLHYFAFKADFTIDIKILSEGRAWFQVYWAARDDAFTENKSTRILLRQGKTHYSVYTGGLGRVDKLRIDPSERPKQFRLARLRINQSGYQPIDLNRNNGFSGLEVAQQIDHVAGTAAGLEFNTTGRDGQFILDLGTYKQGGFSFLHLVNITLILLITAAVSRTCGGYQRRLKFVPVMMLIAAALIFTMAMVSKYSHIDANGEVRGFVHPDENVHVDGVSYYRQYLLPPPIDAEVVADTFSVYGKTRLASRELYYPVAGYLSRLLQPLKNALSTDVRLIMMMFFMAMVVAATALPGFRPFAAPLLLSPQIWYLYSYANSDGFALLLSTVAAYQAACKDSTFNRLLTEEKPAWLWLHVLWLGLLAGALLLSKQNFYVFVFFIGLFMLWRIANGEFTDIRLLWKRIMLVSVVAMLLFGIRLTLDYAVNGPDPAAKVQVLAEIKAAKRFKPSTPLPQKDTYLYLKARGHSLDYILQEQSWGGKTFYNSFGSYGYTQFFATEVFFNLIKVVGWLLLGAIVLSLLVRGPPAMHGLFMITAGCALLVMAASLWVSWSEAFQAQGRYLAPIIPMLGVLYYRSQPYLFHRSVNALLVTMFALSVYSFIFVGLMEIPKVS